jgi:hypothetical protein
MESIWDSEFRIQEAGAGGARVGGSACRRVGVWACGRSAGAILRAGNLFFAQEVTLENYPEVGWRPVSPFRVGGSPDPARRRPRLSGQAKQSRTKDDDDDGKDAGNT